MASDKNGADDSSSPGGATRVRIVSYNILSSNLARASYYTRTDPEHLDYSLRLPKVLAKLEQEMDVDDGEGDAIICLQEVCDTYASDLHAFFAERGYHFIVGRYGRSFNGYMGVGLAYPTSRFETIGVAIERLSESRDGGWPRPPVVEEEEEGVVQSAVKVVRSAALRTVKSTLALLRSSGKLLGMPPPVEQKPPIDPWVMSENRFNVLLTAALREKSTTDTASPPPAFCVSTYHMPCAFFAPPVMNLHSELVARRVQTLAAKFSKKAQGEGGDEDPRPLPYVLAGDFNIMPDSAHYRLLTDGTLPKSDPTYPPPKHGEEWTIGSAAMDSAYAVGRDGGEPELTNYSQVKDDDAFIGTLDFIFLSKGGDNAGDNSAKSGGEWKVRSVKDLPPLDGSGGPFPNAEEPSDHLLIAADLELTHTS